MSAPKICEHGVWEMDTAALADGLCPLCTKAELDRLRAEVAALKAENEQLRIDKITLGNFGCLPAYRTAPPGKEA